MPDEPALYGEMQRLDRLNKLLIALCDTSQQEEREQATERAREQDFDLRANAR